MSAFNSQVAFEPDFVWCIELEDSRAGLRTHSDRELSGGGMMVRVATVFIAALLITGAARADALVDRGSYLVNTIMTCANCHSPKGPPAAVAGKDFSGGLSWDCLLYTSPSPRDRQKSR